VFLHILANPSSPGTVAHSLSPSVEPVDGIGGVRIHPLLMFTEFNPELKKKVLQVLAEGRHERDLLINRVILAELRTRKHGQIPRSIVK